MAQNQSQEWRRLYKLVEECLDYAVLRAPMPYQAPMAARVSTPWASVVEAIIEQCDQGHPGYDLRDRLSRYEVTFPDFTQVGNDVTSWGTFALHKGYGGYQIIDIRGL